MEYRDFVEQVKEQIQDFLPEKFADAAVEVNQIVKNNDCVLDGLMVRTEESNIAPTIYLNPYFEQIQDGAELDDVLAQIASVYQSHYIDHDIDVSAVTDFDKIKEKIVCKLINEEANKQFLQDKPYSKLEDLASSKVKSPKEWECFKTQVLHCFAVAEKIGNRSVNLAEHMNWEDRLVRLGILEKRRDTEKKQENSLRDSVKYDVRNSGGKDDKSEAKAMVSLESALQKNAEQLYMNTGMVPIGYKKDANGKIVRISPKLETGSNTDRLSASRNNLSATAKKEEQRLQR